MYICISPQLVKTAAGALQALLCAPDVQVRIQPPPYAFRMCLPNGQVCELPRVNAYIYTCIFIHVYLFMSLHIYSYIYVYIYICIFIYSW